MTQNYSVMRTSGKSENQTIRAARGGKLESGTGPPISTALCYAGIQKKIAVSGGEKERTSLPGVTEMTFLDCRSAAGGWL